MDYLARGGRINKTIAAASKILNVKPLLTFDNGEIIRAGLVRTMQKGMDRLYEYVKNNIPIDELTIVHSMAEDKADRLRQRLGTFVGYENILMAELGAGLGVHGGPGVLLTAIKKR
jgi:DegV family protein with EDD domain